MFIFVLDCVVSEGNQASYLQTESPECVGSRSNLNSFLKPLWAYSDPLSVCVTMCPIWDLGSNLFYSIALKVFGMLLKIHAYAAWVHGQKFIYNFIGSCSSALFFPQCPQHFSAPRDFLPWSSICCSPPALASTSRVEWQSDREEKECGFSSWIWDQSSSG